MTNTGLRKTIKFIFLPALLLSLLLSCSSALLHFSQNSLIGAQIPALQASAILPQIILALALLIFAMYKPFEKIFRGALLILTAVIALFTVFMSFQEQLEMTHWTASLMYIVLSAVNFNLYSLFIWGFINRLTSLSEGVKYYIPLAFVLGIAGAAVSNLGLMVIGASKWPPMAMMLPALIFMICSFFIFNWSWKRLPNSLIHPKDEPSLQTRFPFLSAAYLLAGSVMVKSFLDTLFKAQLKTQFPDPASYSQFMGQYSMTAGSATMAISIIWLLLGSWLMIKKGWKTTALCASLSILAGGIIYLSLSSSWLNQGIFTGLLMSTAFTLFFPLIQILYLYLPYQSRFKTKIITEMIALPLMKGIPPLATQGLLVLFGSIAAMAFYLKIVVPILLALLIFASYRASPKFSGTKRVSIK